METVNRTQKMQALDRLAWILDSSLKVPGTQWRVGLDGLIGLIPGIGDVTAGAVSSYILLQAVKMGVPSMVIARMALNIVLESVVGAIPVLGDIFDFMFKANQRNVNLMRDYVTNPSPVKRRSTLTVVSVIAGIVALLVFIFWAVFSLLGALIAAL